MLDTTAGTTDADEGCVETVPSIRPQGLGDQREIVWTDDTIIFGLGPNELVTLDITT